MQRGPDSNYIYIVYFWVAYIIVEQSGITAKEEN